MNKKEIPNQYTYATQAERDAAPELKPEHYRPCLLRNNEVAWCGPGYFSHLRSLDAIAIYDKNAVNRLVDECERLRDQNAEIQRLQSDLEECRRTIHTASLNCNAYVKRITELEAELAANKATQPAIPEGFTAHHGGNQPVQFAEIHPSRPFNTERRTSNNRTWHAERQNVARSTQNVERKKPRLDGGVAMLERSLSGP